MKTFLYVMCFRYVPLNAETADYGFGSSFVHARTEAEAYTMGHLLTALECGAHFCGDLPEGWSRVNDYVREVPPEGERLVVGVALHPSTTGLA